MKVKIQLALYFLIFLVAFTLAIEEPIGPPMPPSQTLPTLGQRLMYGPFRLISLAIPTPELASVLARQLVLTGLAATVNIFPTATSVYVWNGTLRELPEVVMFVFTHVNKYEEFEKYIRANHVHVEPGLVSLPIVGGSESFLQWIDGQTNKGRESEVSPHMVEIERNS